MISVNDLRTGLTIKVEGDVYSVIEFLPLSLGKARLLSGLNSET